MAVHCGTELLADEVQKLSGVSLLVDELQKREARGKEKQTRDATCEQIEEGFCTRLANRS